MTSATTEVIPDTLCQSVKKGECILFLGAMASAASPKGSEYDYRLSPPSGAKLAERLVAACGYPHPDVWNLARVALYYETREDKTRYDLVELIRSEIEGPDIVPSPALRMLAALPFRITLTTNYDRLFDEALSRSKTLDGKKKDPDIHIYDPQGQPRVVKLDPPEDAPVLFKLHGDIKHPESIVISEEDYITFIERMRDDRRNPLHRNLRARLNSWRVLFIGYSLRDYNLRLLFRALRWDTAPAEFPLSFSVDPNPDDVIVAILEQGQPRVVNFVRQSLWTFVPALYEACTGENYRHEGYD